MNRRRAVDNPVISIVPLQGEVRVVVAADTTWAWGIRAGLGVGDHFGKVIRYATNMPFLLIRDYLTHSINKSLEKFPRSTVHLFHRHT